MILWISAFTASTYEHILKVIFFVALSWKLVHIGVGAGCAATRNQAIFFISGMLLAFYLNNMIVKNWNSLCHSKHSWVLL